jgi:hypothetical protein
MLWFTKLSTYSPALINVQNINHNTKSDVKKDHKAKYWNTQPTTVNYSRFKFKLLGVHPDTTVRHCYVCCSFGYTSTACSYTHYSNISAYQDWNKNYNNITMKHKIRSIFVIRIRETECKFQKNVNLRKHTTH